MTQTNMPGPANGTITPAPHTGPAPIPAAKRFYLPELDSLRFFAFLAVFICHAFADDGKNYANTALPGPVVAWAKSVVQAGAFGVDLFFMLSSFLITSLLVREHRYTGAVDVRGFWIRRCLRIWPLYFFFVAVAGFVLPAIFHFIPKLDAPLTYGLLTFTHNWVAAIHGLGAGSPTLILWSVSLEEQFYLAWPLLIVFAGISRMRTIAIGMIVVAIVARVFAVAAGASSLMIWSATPLRMEPIAIGALVALYADRLPAYGLSLRAAMLGIGIFIPIALSLPALSWSWGDVVKFPAVSIACLLVFLAVLGADVKALKIKPLVYLGKISYGLYVYHLLAIQFSPRLAIPGIPLGKSLAAFALTVALAALSYRFLESPFLRMKDKFAHIQSRPA